MSKTNTADRYIPKDSRRKEQITSHPVSVRRIGAVAASAGLLAAGIITNERQNASPGPVDMSGPYREYTVKNGDSEWGIGTRAFPDTRPEVASDYVDDQNPNPNHILIRGQKIHLPPDAQIGKLIKPSAPEG